MSRDVIYTDFNATTDVIYADFNATTPLGAGAKNKMQEAFEAWGNPSSSHQIGRSARKLLDEARESVARACGVNPGAIVFTSGGSEANVLAIWGSQLCTSGFRLLTSSIEHSSIRDLIPMLKTAGTDVRFVTLTPEGELDFEAFTKHVLDFNPHLISLMTANNETGIRFPISEIVELCREKKIMLHTDAVQAFGKMSPGEFNGADFISISAHKIYGPKGAGALIIRNNRKLMSTHYGGSQEIKRRGGTENMIGITGFGGACSELETTFSQVQNIRDLFEQILEEKSDRFSIIGKNLPRIPNTSNVRFHGITADVLLSILDLEGMCVSAGSACSSGSITPSHVLLAMGLPSQEAKECLRISWGRTSTESESRMLAEALVSHVTRIRTRLI